MSLDQFRSIWGSEIDSKLSILMTPHVSPTQNVTTIRINPLKSSLSDLVSQLSSLLRPMIVYPSVLVPDVICIDAIGPVQREACQKAIYLDVNCAESVLRGADVYVPGVLGSVGTCNPYVVQTGEMISLYYSPKVLLRGTRTEFLYGDSVFIGNGIAAMSRKAVFSSEKGLAVTMNERIYISPSLNQVLPGLIFPQHLPCTVACLVLNVKR